MPSSRVLEKYWLNSAEFALPAMSSCYPKLYSFAEKCGKFENAVKIVAGAVCFKKNRVFTGMFSFS